MTLYGLFICLIAGLVLTGFRNVTEEIEEFYPEIETVLEKEPASVNRKRQPGPGYILETYRDPETRGLVEEYFERLCGSRVLALIILENASLYDIAPALAFSLCFEESRYSTRAVNSKNSNQSVDRGLFQLNNFSFPELREQDFFDPNVNARLGLSHLRWCLDNAGTDVAGLAMYNAGTGKVKSGGTPKVTLDYVSRILSRQRYTEEIFLAWFLANEPIPEEIEMIEEVIEIIIVEEEEPVRSKFIMSLLSPLGRR